MSRPRILVLGAGALGLGAAWRLAQAGCAVTVLDPAARAFSEASGAAAGMIGAQSEAMEDDAYFRATLESRDRWPALAAALQVAVGHGFGFHPDGCIHLAFGASYERRLEAKYLWQKERAGTLTQIRGEALRQRWPMLSPRVSCAYLASGDQWVDNEALGPALQAAAMKAGAVLRLGEGALSLERAGSAWRVRSSLGNAVEAEQVLVCSGAWARQVLEPLFPEQELLKSFPVKGQMLELRVPASLRPELPVHAEAIYLVPRGAEQLVVGATVETVGFDKRVTAEGVEWLLQGAFETIPDLRSCELVRTWAGLRPGSPDGWPVFGAGPAPGLHLGLGAYRRGILLLPLAVETMVASVLGKPVPEEAKAFALDRALRPAVA
jgi:glycine oxidase